MKRILYPFLGSVIITAQIITGCSVLGNKKIADAYSFERYQVETGIGKPGFVKLFSSDLCVIDDENKFQSDEFTSESAVLMNVTDQKVLYSKNAFKELYPASITKVMTALIAIKYGNLADQVVITPEAMVTEPGSSLANIKPREVYTLEQLLYGLMLPSGNDAASAIAIHMAGDMQAFSKIMEQEAAALGASHTHFKNPHGLTEDGHYTTAYDLYLIFNEALKYSEFRDIINTTTYTAEYIDENGDNAMRTWSGGNWYMSGERETPDRLTVIGGKTGTTIAAGNCLIMLTTDRQNKEYISVVLKASNRPGLYDNMTTLIKKILD